MSVSGGLRFLPVYGKSGSGKSCAARELDTHLPQTRVVELTRQSVQSESALLEQLRDVGRRDSKKPIIAIIDQYEESVAQAEDIPTQFVERLSLLDRSRAIGVPILFVWLTTSEDFQGSLEAATSRNERILLASGFSLAGPEEGEWTSIVEETFSFHNQEQPLADFGVLVSDIRAESDGAPTLGATIERVGRLLGRSQSSLQDLSEHQVVMVWPVTDALRITRVAGFTALPI